jgi:hypothetical protein
LPAPLGEVRLRLRHSSVYFRYSGSTPEMIVEHGCEAGGAFVVGEAELRRVEAEIGRLLHPTAAAGA